MLKSAIASAEVHQKKLQKILSIGPLSSELDAQISRFEPGRVSVEIRGRTPGRVRLSGPALFSAADIIGCFSLWQLQAEIRSIFTTNMSWSCYRPIVGSAFEIDAQVLGGARNLATVGLTIMIVRPVRSKAASALATGYLRGFDYDATEGAEGDDVH